MIVDTRSGDRLLKLADVFVARNGHIMGKSYRDDLTNIVDSRYDIIAIYKTYATSMDRIFNEEQLVQIWRRKESGRSTKDNDGNRKRSRRKNIRSV